MTDASRLKATVYVGGLDSAVTSTTLHDAFIPFGDIVEVNLPKPEAPSSKSLHRGYGYVEFELSEDAKEAIDNMDQSELFGRVIKVSQAKPQKQTGEGLGSKTAIWEQEGWLAKNAVSEEDRNTTTQSQSALDAQDPMEGLQGLDEAGPKPA